MGLLFQAPEDRSKRINYNYGQISSSENLGDLMRLAITQTPVKDYQLTLMWKKLTRKNIYNNMSGLTTDIKHELVKRFVNARHGKKEAFSLCLRQNLKMKFSLEQIFTWNFIHTNSKKDIKETKPLQNFFLGNNESKNHAHLIDDIDKAFRSLSICISSILSPNLYRRVGTGCWIRRLHLCRRARTPPPKSVLDFTLNQQMMKLQS